jgi:antitoxin component of MazEF toxin-antitoxin module
MIEMKSVTELNLGTQKIKKMGPNNYIRIPKQLVDSGAIPIDAEYKVRIILKNKEIVIEEKTDSKEAPSTA